MNILKPLAQYLDVGTMMRDMQLAVAAAGFAAGCKTAFGLGMQRMPESRLPRQLWSVTVVTLLLALQPHIYRTPTQPLSILIAALGVFDAFCILVWGCIKPVTTHPGPSVIINSSFHFMMDGVLKKHKQQQSKLQHPEAADAALLAKKQHDSTSSTLAASAAADKPKQRQATDARVRPVIHVTAVAGPVPPPTATSTAAINIIAQYGSRSCRSPSQELSTASWNHGKGSHSKNTQTALWSAILTHIQLCIMFDLAYAALCCCTHMCNPAAHFSNSISRYAFSHAAGILVVLQMSIGYAWTRVCVIASGDLAFTAELPQYAFNHPMLATSVADLWSNRWHQFLRYHFQNLGYGFVNLTVRPLIQPLPTNQQKYILSTANTLAVFAMSGLLHEYIIWAAFGACSGLQLAFFMINALIVLLESNLSELNPCLTAAMPVWVKRVYATTVVVMLSPLFTEPHRQNGYFKHCFHPMMWPVTATAAKVLGLGCCAGYV